MTTVHQVLSGAGPHDAVTNQARFIRRLLDSWGWGGDDYAIHIDPRVRDIAPLHKLAPAKDDVLLVHYSAYAPRLRRVLDMPQKTVLLSHNVTPARWLWDHDAMIAVYCALGRAQLPDYAARADVVAGVSLFNAAELGSDQVVPILFDPAGTTPRTSDPTDPVELLFVGRLAPHKRQDELIRLIAMLRAHRLPGARLRLVGEALNPRYLAALQGLADQLAPGAVVFESGLSDAELSERYRRATAFVCLSEHEGFCIPLLESFAHGVPVVSRPVGGIPEVASGAALLVDDRDLAVVCELVAMLVEDAALRDTLRARMPARLEAYSPQQTAQKLRELLTHGVGRNS